MKGKVIHFSDFHAHMFEDFAKPDPEFVNDRFRAQIMTLHKVFDLARQHKAALVFGGDLFHKRKTLEDTVYNEVYKVFVENQDVPVHLIRGNHDSRDNTTEARHWLETFDYIPNVEVSAVPEAIQVTTPDRSTINLYTVPYSDDVEFLKKKIKEFAEMQKSSSNPSILAGHIGVDGSETGRYSHRLEGAFKVGDLYPDVFDYVALGHYHKRQFLGGTDNVFYTGNTIQTSFSDEGQEKGVFLMDFEKGGKPEFIPIKNKQFITLTSIDENTQEIVDNNYVRFVLPKEQAQEVEIFKEESDNVRVEIQREYKTETRIDISVKSSEEQIVTAYTQEFYPDTTDLAVDILKEAMSRSA
ncbi:putative DNA repair exonuclease 1 [Bacillus phage BSP38]|uniref:Putative DNA repair exonuclease 1 n=1 Tax=Bacillus phage BSP38 TaxID=2283013 RepID=A0A345MJW9_BPBSP|nr:putative DNA repair exonuclease 1 [Bacillus phage BSP38]AXH71151.1 putative DNA repair exonuclease 1 [Bacillus phage BSP38]